MENNFHTSFKKYFENTFMCGSNGKVVYIFGQVPSWGIKSMTIARGDGFGQPIGRL
jgi:hypothetical protein